MEKINITLIKKNIKITNSKRKLNQTWEVADEFAKYVGLNTIFVLKIFKIYGEQNVLALRSYLKDFPDKKTYKDKCGLITWKLKENLKLKNSKV